MTPSTGTVKCALILTPRTNFDGALLTKGYVYFY